MTLTLRLISDCARTAAFNMAADLYFMEKCVDTSCICFRTYAWSPAAITIGQMQRAASQLDLSQLENDGIDWVRRPTGGRAVLHCNDCTYSCIFPKTVTEMGTSVEETYTIIMKCLVAGLKILGIDPQIHDSADPLIKSGRHVKLPCFLAPNRNEIMVNGRKLVGSAQYRNKAAVLQHGSIPVTTDAARLPDYLQITEEEKELQKRLLEKKSISITEIKPEITFESLAAALRKGFASTINCKLVETPLQPMELAGIEQLLHSDAFIRQWLADPAS